MPIDHNTYFRTVVTPVGSAAGSDRIIAIFEWQHSRRGRVPKGVRELIRYHLYCGHCVTTAVKKNG